MFPFCHNSCWLLGKSFANCEILTDYCPIKLEKKSNNKDISLFLATIDHFEADEFMRLMGLAKDISTNLVGEVIIAFPDYDQLKHSNVVNELKQGFQDADFTKTVSVINYINPINAL